MRPPPWHWSHLVNSWNLTFSALKSFPSLTLIHVRSSTQVNLSCPSPPSGGSLIFKHDPPLTQHVLEQMSMSDSLLPLAEEPSIQRKAVPRSWVPRDPRNTWARLIRSFNVLNTICHPKPRAASETPIGADRQTDTHTHTHTHTHTPPEAQSQPTTLDLRPTASPRSF